MVKPPVLSGDIPGCSVVLFAAGSKIIQKEISGQIVGAMLDLSGPFVYTGGEISPKICFFGVFILWQEVRIHGP
jgi:hypothetical protein